MTNVYNTGTVSVPSNSNIVTGTDTYFQSVGNISEGDLFTLDGKAFFEIYQIDTDNQLRIKGRLDGQPYAGEPVSDAEYSIIQNFAEAPIAQVAQNVVLLQQKWHQREDEMTGWFNSKNNYYQITNQHGEKVLVVTPTGLTKLVDGTIDIGDGSGLAELVWENLQNIPETASRWAKFSEITDKPEHVLGYPSFDKVTGTLSEEQLPQTVTANKRSLAESPPVRQNPSLTHILSDYPTLKKTVDIPTQSPNNRREFLFDDARQVAYVALTEKWLKIPTTISTRKFMVVKAGRYLRFNSAFTGDVTLRVYPMGNGGTGLPTSPVLADYQWHTITVNVTNLWTLGRDNGNYFEGIIDFVELTTPSGNNWERLDSEKSKFSSLNAYFDNDYSTPRTPFETFELRQDGYWYSQDITPDTPYSIGASWTQDSNDPRLYYANNVSDSNDGVRFFNDAYDNYEVEMIVVAEIDRPLALTSSNESDLTVKFSGTERFICDSRLFLKRTNSALSVTGQIRIESIRIRVPNNG